MQQALESSVLPTFAIIYMFYGKCLHVKTKSGRTSVDLKFDFIVEELGIFLEF